MGDIEVLSGGKIIDAETFEKMSEHGISADDVADLMTPKQFERLIDEIAAADGVSHMDAIIDVIARGMYSYEDIPHMCTPSLKQKIARDARDINLMPKMDTLEGMFE